MLSQQIFISDEVCSFGLYSSKNPVKKKKSFHKKITVSTKILSGTTVFDI